ncbi:MAG: hypothetical protein M3P50_00950, partial [Actinomycetota bacterium]|nr:hypothetical protein [Actinomycetota bacterium]
PTATPGPTATPSPGGTPTPTPTPTPALGDPGSGTGTGTAALEFDVDAVRNRFCTRRGAACRRPGILLDFDLSGSERAPIQGVLRRRPLRGSGASRRSGRVRFTAQPGEHRVRLLRTTTGKRIGPGRYVLSLRAADGDSTVKTVRFAVTR